MSEFEKGDRVAVHRGKDAGVRGEVFWIGENKFGDGMRYGVRGDDGETYWVDEEQVGKEDGAPPPPKPKPEGALAKGDAVEITQGAGTGTRGEVFWVGKSKFGDGMRYGVRDADGEAHWVDDHQVKSLGGGAKKSGGEKEKDAPPPEDDAPFPDDDDFVGDDDDFVHE